MSVLPNLRLSSPPARALQPRADEASAAAAAPAAETARNSRRVGSASCMGRAAGSGAPLYRERVGDVEPVGAEPQVRVAVVHLVDARLAGRDRVPQRARLQ